MRGRRVTAVLGATVAALLVLGAAAAAASHIPYGPGPRSHYTVQAQPAAGRCHYRSTPAHQPLPDPSCTPGALNPKVTQATITSTICRSGYTSQIRPPESVTGPEKVANARSYGYRGSLGVAEYDHLVPLELGGDPNDPRNLWVEPPSPGHNPASGVNNPKDAIEGQARSLVCSHTVALARMQAALVSNWTTAIAVVTHAPTGGGRGPLSCAARTSNARPAQNTTVDVFVATKPAAAVTAAAHYKTRITTHAGVAGPTGAATVAFFISRATKGYKVQVSVHVALAGASANCATSFTPQ